MERTPNIVLIFMDDLGYADIGPFGAKGYATPHLDELARAGRCFTDFEVSSAVCSASRAALMTGCYHRRVGISGALGPGARVGLASEETTLAELCRSKNYRTACFGKWHLGSLPEFLPLQHGFDQYYGLPYSNDMWPMHPDFVDLPADAAKRKQNYPPLPLLEGNAVLIPEVDGTVQSRLTTDYTERAVKFIEESGDEPFFLYVPHTMVHVPLFVSEKFAGKSGAGLFGDVMMEVDWSVGEIVAAVQRAGVAENTLIIFTSDNGPWLSYGSHAGSAAPLREGKGTMWEGGTRVPTIMSWPGRIPSGTECSELASTIDLLPTIGELIGASLPELPIDGVDISPLLFAETSDVRTPRESFYYYYAGGELHAVRDREWKLVFPHQYRTMGEQRGGEKGRPVAYQQARAELALYHLKSDVQESRNVLAENPDVVQRLQALAAEARKSLGDKLTGDVGNALRQPGRVEAPKSVDN